jgi:hypothetical protein
MLRNLRQLITWAVGLGALTVLAGAVSAQAASPIGAYTTKGAYTFVTDPNLHPPKLSVDAPVNFKKLAPGYFMIANFKNLTAATPMIGQGGPLILDSHLQPVWFHSVGTDVLSVNLRAQTFEGKPVLTWWEGLISSLGVNSNGTYRVYDQHYRQVAALTGADGWNISEHEMKIDGHNAWVTAYKTVPMDLTPYGGAANGLLLDSAVQEYDLRTGKLLYNWDAQQHISPADSETHAPVMAAIPWDAYHVNSIQLERGGKFLVSMRNTWAAYLVDIKTQSIDWILGGKRSTFALKGNAVFHWQHDAELHSGNQVSVFDDACCAILPGGKFGPVNGPSRGLVLKLDPARHTGKLVRQYIHSDRLNAAFLGNTELLPNGNVAIGWGSQPVFSEYTSGGTQLLDAVLPSPDLTYRALVQNWVGTPSYPPRGAVRSVKGKTTVYASWDGATEVTAWRVLAGPGKKHLASVAVAGKSGFETAIRLAHGYKAYAVQALDSRGRVLRTSTAFGAGPPSPGFY